MICAGIAFAACAHAAVVDKIVVIVNDEAITQREVDRKIGPLLQQFHADPNDPKMNDKIDGFVKQVIDQLIDEKLLISEAKRKDIQISADEVRRQVNEVKKRFDNDEQFEFALRQQGLSVNDLENNYRGSLMSKKLIDTEIGQKIQITPQEMFAYYDSHKKDFEIPRRAKVRSIVIKTRDGKLTPEEVTNRIEDIRKRLKDGEDFSKIACDFSDSANACTGGDMGYIKEGEMKKSIDDTIFALKPGEVSETIKTDLGYHIFKMEDIKEAELPGFESVSKEVERIIYKEKIKEKLDQFLKHLRENAYIEFK